MKFQLPDGLSMYYEISGNADAAETIVFLNGLSQSTLAWTAVAPAFAADYRVLLVDFIFQGQSDAAEDYRSYDQHADDLAALIEHIGIDSLHVAGISYGSAAAQHFAVKYPERVSKLILLSTFAHNTPIFNAIGESWASALHAGGYPLMLDVMLPVVLGENYFQNPLVPIETLKTLRVQNSLSTRNLLLLMRATELRGDFRPKLKAISAPALIIQGEHDILIPPKVAEEVARHIPGAKFEVIPGVGHTLNLEAIPQTIQLIRDFIR